ncbi:hypothetical protein DXG03_000717 [Asterophora parasitica]|uniref:MICOS complex subunit MIC12 n=1 Tax=Asterophora parasitica TaxID=117018 RepID=A0A9P7GA64_9AGAR|nr:hypothetical protein DXG03_000717 [Asterophora parasitica]
MSALIGPVSDEKLTIMPHTQVYYGFSNLMRTQTEHLRSDLLTISERLSSTTPLATSPLSLSPPASARITPRPFSTLLKDKWNHELGALFAGFGSWDRRVGEWGRSVLYGYAFAGKVGEQTDSPAEPKQQEDASST